MFPPKKDGKGLALMILAARGKKDKGSEGPMSHMEPDGDEKAEGEEDSGGLEALAMGVRKALEEKDDKALAGALKDFFVAVDVDE